MPRTLLLLSLARRFSFISARPVVAALSLLNNNSSKRHLRIKKKRKNSENAVAYCCCCFSCYSQQQHLLSIPKYLPFQFCRRAQHVWTEYILVWCVISWLSIIHLFLVISLILFVLTTTHTEFTDSIRIPAK